MRGAGREQADRGHEGNAERLQPADLVVSKDAALRNVSEQRGAEGSNPGRELERLAMNAEQRLREYASADLFQFLLVPKPQLLNVSLDGPLADAEAACYTPS